MITVKYPVALISAFLWTGFVCSISFMESWLKFSAPGITVPVALEIGKLVFNAMNKAEWVFAIAIAANILLSKRRLINFHTFLYLIPLVVLVLQTFWMLKVLDARADLLIHGQSVPPSSLHFYYIAVEALKVVCLAIFGITLFKTMTK